MLSTREMRHLICAHHYTHSIPSGENIFTQFEDAVIVFSRPANKNVSRWLLGADNYVWELSRMWAPDGHRRTLLTEAIAACVEEFAIAVKRLSAGTCTALVSYADPNAGHTGTVYRAASWSYLGQSEESRYYTGPNGEIVSRRSFHSSDRHLTKKQILERGFMELSRPGKHRFARGLVRWSRDRITKHAARPLDAPLPKGASAVQPRGAAPNLAR
jgi:hypothetical protein